MQTITNSYAGAIDASVRKLKAKAELYNGSSLVASYTQNDAIKSITIERVGEDSKFFGFGVTHKFNIKLIDVARAINLSTFHSFKISLGVVLNDGSVEYKPFPMAFVTEVNRDENTNELSITAYDVLKNTKTATVGDLALTIADTSGYTIKAFIEAISVQIGASGTVIPDLAVFDTEYLEGANFEGTETLQEALQAAAEATQTIYYINGEDALVFKRLAKDAAPDRAISRDNYITLDNRTNRRLQTICSATELGDNVSASTSEIGTTQYVRDNPFWELREDINILVDNALAAMGGITINQFSCEWRGDPALEPGDKLALATKDKQVVYSYLLNDKLVYDGSLTEETEWNYTENESETESNPISLGETLKKTFAKVDKANKQIDLLVEETSANSSAISTLQLNNESINASVQKVETSTNATLESINTELDTLTKKVEATVTAEEVNIAIKSELSNGVSKVETTTGFTLGDDGLTIAKTGREMSTNIDEDGMTIKRADEERLVADSEGVSAYNLWAKTYLIVGTPSRFEDYEKNGELRTGCFWTGGGN